ncbi:MAG: acyl-CoA thioesterase [Thermoleophilia bacterium]|nr:acyl-CoA thioesterase [Thermoleophilia bacterium]
MSEKPSGRADYPHFLEIPTRWNDNDVYGHVNNVDYYAFFDTVINEWLINRGGLDIHGGGGAIGVCAESHCSYREALSFPETVEAGLRVGKLGNSSVRYEIGIFKAGEEQAGASGWFVHVFVDPQSREPVPIPEGIRASLEQLVVSEGRR